MLTACTVLQGVHRAESFYASAQMSELPVSFRRAGLHAGALSLPGDFSVGYLLRTGLLLGRGQSPVQRILGS